MNNMEKSEAQHGTKLRPFDPSEHGGNLAQAFDKFLRLYKCKAWDRTPPTGTTGADVNIWIARDMVKQLRGHYSTDRFMDDIEAVVTEAEMRTITFNELVTR